MSLPPQALSIKEVRCRFHHGDSARPRLLSCCLPLASIGQGCRVLGLAALLTARQLPSVATHPSLLLSIAGGRPGSGWRYIVIRLRCPLSCAPLPLFVLGDAQQAAVAGI
jgi:hypothetical protein